MLSEVEFHTGVADCAGFACRLLRKASRAGLRVLVTAPAPLLAEVDRLLWTFDDRDFIPHLRWPGASPAMAARTPIWLAASAVDVAGAAGAPRLLVNLGSASPVDASAVDRLIEVVGTDPDTAAAARERWRGYKAAGLAIRHHPSA